MRVPISAIMSQKFARELRIVWMAACVLVLAAFSYFSYLAYAAVAGTRYYMLSYVIAMPVFVAGFLFVLLVFYGKTFYKEIEELEKFRVKL